MASHITMPQSVPVSPQPSPASGRVARRIAAIENRTQPEVLPATISLPIATLPPENVIVPPALAPTSSSSQLPTPTSTTAASPSALSVAAAVPTSPLTASLWGEDAALTTQGAALKLHTAMKGVGCNNKEVFRLLADRSSEEIKLIRQDFRTLTGDSLTSWMKHNLWGNHFKQAMLLCLGDKINPIDRDAQLLSLAMNRAGTNENLVLDTLYGKSDEHRSAVAEHYEALTGETLRDALKREHTGTREVFALAAYDRGNITTADRIYAATRGLWNDYDAVYRALEGKSPQELQSIQQEFAAVYGKDLEEHLESRMYMWPRSLTKAKALLKSGHLLPEDNIKLTLMGWTFLGYGISPRPIEESIAGLSDDERQEVRLRYAAKYGDLDQDLKSKLGEYAYKDVTWCLKHGELTEAQELHRAMRGMGADKNTLIEVLEGKDLQELYDLKAEYRDHYGEELVWTIAKEFWGDVGKQLVILAETGKLSLADKIYFATSGISYDKEAIFKALQEATPEDRAALQETYKTKYKGNVSKMLHSMWDSRAVKRAELTLEHGELSFIQKLDVEMTGLGADKRALYTAIESATPEERSSVLENYGMMDRITDELSGKSRERVMLLLRQGTLNRSQKLYFAMEGWGTNEALIHSTLKDLLPSERVAIQKEYRENYGVDLLKELKKELGSRDLAECVDALAQPPRTLRERLERTQKKVCRERGSGSARSRVSDTIVDAFSNAGFELDHVVREYKHLIREGSKMKLNGTFTDEDANGIPDDVEVLLNAKEVQVDDATDDYMVDKESISNKITSIATMTAVATAMAASAGTATPALIGIAAGTAAATKVTSRFITVGDAYNATGFDAAHDIVTGAASGASMAILGAVSDAVTAGIGLGAEAAEGLTAAGTTTGTASSAATSGAASQLSYELLRQKGSDWMGQTLGRKIFGKVVLGGFQGAVSSSINTAAESAMTDETWDQEFLDSVKSIVSDTGAAALSGAQGWAMGSLTGQIGAIASESVMVNLRIRMGERIGAGREFSDEELIEAGHDILGDDAETMDADGIKTAGYHKILSDLGDDYLKNTVEGKVLAASVSNAVSRSAATYPKTFANKLSSHRVWENGFLTGINEVLTGATTSAVRDIGLRTITATAGIGADEAGIAGAQKVAMTNLVKRGLSASV
ncbi:MAG: hypothetical protein HOK28_19350 [Deltaproteobacteria bacterium]|jgi:hypothetical protein|nr:hypothetical protein [Deltaproteobacteria bacterium]